MTDAFYIGYRKQMTSVQARFLRWRLVVLVAGLLVAGTALVGLQRPFGAGRFEFGVVKAFEGILGEFPYPTLLLAQPVPGGDATGSRVMLVAPGKHGAQALVRGRAGQKVALNGALIQRGGQTMIEVRPESLQVQPAGAAGAAAAPVALGTFTLRGEIVDSKCYLGVMKPGNLKPHKACAIRCISGGCTPLLVVRDAAGLATYLMLAGADGRPVNAEVLGLVAEPLEITGAVERRDNLLVLKADPAAYRRLP